MGNEDIGEIIKVMGYKSPFSIYGREVAVLTDKGVYAGVDGGNLQEVTDPKELDIINSMLSMQNPHKIQC